MRFPGPPIPIEYPQQGGNDAVVLSEAAHTRDSSRLLRDFTGILEVDSPATYFAVFAHLLRFRNVLRECKVRKPGIMILIVDNYDSFTYNLVQRLGELDNRLDIRVFRNDQVTVDEIESLQPSHLIISPGPCTPTEAGISVACIERLAGKLPILGVCLGHQSIGQATGGKIVRARQLMHGKADRIFHDGRGLFVGLPNPFVATRYHSLVIQPDTLHPDFEITAWAPAPDGSLEIMGIRHRSYCLEGVQFHPESFLTGDGPEMLRRFLEMRWPQ